MLTFFDFHALCVCCVFSLLDHLGLVAVWAQRNFLGSAAVRGLPLFSPGLSAKFAYIV